MTDQIAAPFVGAGFAAHRAPSRSRRDKALEQARNRHGLPSGAGMIGPNAVTQMLDVIAEENVPGAEAHFLRRAGLTARPSLDGMIPEVPAALLHQAVREDWPRRSPDIAAEAGVRTAAYILRHRIPRPAQALLRALPASLSGPLLARAIASNAWTFAGSGQFRILSFWPMVFEIVDNPVTRGAHSTHPICHWHAAVFETLFDALVHPGIRCKETECCAMGAPACRFELIKA